MKKFILSIIATLFMFIGVATTANAQTHYKDPAKAFQHCQMYVDQANRQYASRQFLDAKANYTRALDCNASCTGKKFMSDRKLKKKIKNCDYAIAHGGVTREEKAEQTWATIGAVLAVGAAAGVAVAAATDNHNDSHHDYHHDSHHDHHHHEYVEVYHHNDTHYNSISEALRHSHR